MSMNIRNNNAANMVLGEWRKNDSKLAKDLKRASSGTRVTGAGDDAASYSISEKMKTMIRSLGQDIDNAKKGIDLVKTAEDGIDNIVDQLRTLKALAINSANDHNAETDRATLQKEFNRRIEEINDIAGETNYNGKILLDGRYRYQEYDENNQPISPLSSNAASMASTTSLSVAANAQVAPMSSSATLSASKVPLMHAPLKAPSANNTDGSIPIGESYATSAANHEKFADDLLASDNLPVTGKSPYALPANAATYTIDSSNTIHITTSGTFDIPSGYSGTIEVSASDVVINGDGQLHKNTKIQVLSPQSNLWINNLNISCKDDSCISFTGSKNSLMLMGHNFCKTFETSINYDAQAVIYGGDKVTIYNSLSSSEGTLRVTATGVPLKSSSVRAGIGVNQWSTGTGGVFINSGTIATSTVNGAGIGSSASQHAPMISISNGRVISTAYGGAAGIGLGSCEPKSAKVLEATKIEILKDAMVTSYSESGAGIGAGTYDEGYVTWRPKVWSINISSSNVQAYSYHAEALGNGSGTDLSKYIGTNGGWTIPHMVFVDYPIKSIKTASGAYYHPYDNTAYTGDKIVYHLYEGTDYSTEIPQKETGSTGGSAGGGSTGGTTGGGATGGTTGGGSTGGTTGGGSTGGTTGGSTGGTTGGPRAARQHRLRPRQHLLQKHIVSRAIPSSSITGRAQTSTSASTSMTCMRMPWGCTTSPSIRARKRSKPSASWMQPSITR